MAVSVFIAKKNGQAHFFAEQNVVKIIEGWRSPADVPEVFYRHPVRIGVETKKDGHAVTVRNNITAFCTDIQIGFVVVHKQPSKRTEAAEAASGDVSEAVDEFMRWLNSARAVVYLENIHKHARMNSEELVTKALRKLNAGKDPEKVITQLANTLAKRILHLPSTRLREAAEQQDEELLRVANRLFEPEDQP